MNRRQQTLDALDALGIGYTLHEHPPAHTIHDCLAIPSIDWTRTQVPKNVFLCNRQQTAFYLMLLRHHVPFRTAVVSKALGVSRLSFAPDTLLPDLLGLQAGAVSPLGLLYDTGRRVTLALDEGLRAATHLALHPCENTATLVLRAEDFFLFLSKINRQPLWVKADKEAIP